MRLNKPGFCLEIWFPAAYFSEKPGFCLGGGALGYNPGIPIFALIPAFMNDASLCQLIREALHSPEKAEALGFAIDQLPEIKRYLDKGWLPYYDEALPITEKDVKRNINQFPQMYRLNLETVNCQNPSEAANVRECFIKWVKMILKRDCQDVKRRRGNQPRIISTSETIGGEDGLTIEETIDSTKTLNPDEIPTLEGLAILIAQEELLENQRTAALILRLLPEYMEQLSEKMLSWLEEISNCYPAGYPQANCSEILQRRLLRTPPQQWKELANELQIPYGTVTAHWDRKCKPMLTQIEQNLER